MDVDNLIAKIESVANPAYASEWDISGLHVIGERKEIKKLALSLDPTYEIVLKADKWGADFILTHHPLVLSPRLPNRDDEYTKVLRQLLKRGIWLYCAHTSLDVNLKGPAGWLVRYLELKDIKPIEPIKGTSDEDLLGFGLIGDLEQEIPFSHFMEKINSVLQRKNIIVIGKEPHRVKRIGYCTGSGMSLGKKGFLLGADVYISGDIKYHLAQEIEKLGYTIDVGHFILEEIMMKTWAEDLKKDLIAHDIEIKFFPGREPIFIKEV